MYDKYLVYDLDVVSFFFFSKVFIILAPPDGIALGR